MHYEQNVSATDYITVCHQLYIYHLKSSSFSVCYVNFCIAWMYVQHVVIFFAHAGNIYHLGRVYDHIISELVIIE